MAFRNGPSKAEPKTGSVIPESLRDKPLESEQELYERQMDYEAQQEPYQHPPEALRKLEMHLSKTPLDQITDEILTLTYAEMMELVRDIRAADIQNGISETLNLADVLHTMAITRNQKKGGENDQTKTQG